MKLERNPLNRKGSRNIFCIFYGDCLNDAVKNAWDDWDCTDCGYRLNMEGAPEIPCRVNHSVAYYEVIR